MSWRLPAPSGASARAKGPAKTPARASPWVAGAADARDEAQESNLRPVASERPPFFASVGNIRDALALAETQGHFVVDEVSPAKAAAHLSIPVLLIHGAVDRETAPAHSERGYQALAGPKRLVLLPKARHRVGLDEATWKIIDAWVAGWATLATLARQGARSGNQQRAAQARQWLPFSDPPDGGREDGASQRAGVTEDTPDSEGATHRCPKGTSVAADARSEPRVSHGPLHPLSNFGQELR
jgi:hypothetical protein